MDRVFVYGTLRTDASNSFRMAGARSMGTATVKARLYQVDAKFPGVILSESKNEILVGEVFSDVSSEHLLALDTYEGCDPATPVSERIYRRVTTTALLDTGEMIGVYLWEYIREVKETDRIASGDWLLE